MASVNVLGTDKPIQTAKGGTGLDATSVYNVVCGGTTTTGPLQQVASVGTSGHVLTSNGAGALPTFQVAPGGGGGGNGLDIRTKAWVYDDFISSFENSPFFSDAAPWISEIGHPGVLSVSSKFIATELETLGVFNLLNMTVGSLKLISYIKDTTTTGQCWIGFSLNKSSSTNFFGFRRKTGDGKFYAVTINASVETEEDTGITAANQWRSFQVESNSDGTSVDFTIDGVLTNTITTNLPTSMLGGLIRSASMTLLVDSLYVEQTVPDRT